MNAFRQGLDDPAVYDRDALDYLTDKYAELIQAVFDRLGDCWYESGMLCREEHLVEKNAIARHLLAGFAAYDALGILPQKHIDTIYQYSRYRVIPALAFNEYMESGTSEEIRKAGLYILSAQLVGFRKIGFSESSENLWKIHCNCFSRVSQLAYEEVCRRYDENHLYQPCELLTVYQSDMTPLLRSSVLEPMMLSAVSASGREIKDRTWLFDFEKMRQLLDELADVRQDINAGRLTYPTLLALNCSDLQQAAASLIKRCWQSRSKSLNNNDWCDLKGLIFESGAVDNIKNRVLTWIGSVAKSIRHEKFPGDITPLLTLVELKRAFLYRLLQNELENSNSNLKFYSQ